MDIVEHYVKLNDTISQLEDQATALRQDLVRERSHLRSTQYPVVVRHQAQRVFKTELLPPEILNDPQFWDVAVHEQVDMRPVDGCPSFLRPDSQVQVDLLRYRC